ncbi:MAG: TonB-dependent receptor, partial [Acidobacteriaceae bacterium]|nr:TonB-dependent receptor [Acidobacteriaceae bacterium]
MAKISCVVFVAMLYSITGDAAVGGEIRGIVLDSNSGEPLSNVAIQIAGLRSRTISDSTGHFHLRDIPAGDHSLNVSTIGYWPVTAQFHIDTEEAKEFEVVLTPETQRRVDTVSVPARYNSLPDAPALLSLSGYELKNLSSVLVDDPLRAVQALPGVSSNDDFEARFSLRGAGFDRIGVYLDGILLHEPFHTIATIGASGSITALNTDLIETLDLYEAAYPVRFGDRSAGILDVHSRDGTRERYLFRVSASFANATAMAEGPLGKVDRCSWITGFRKSYLQYLLPHTRDPSLALGLTDGEARLSCGISSKNNVSADFIDSSTGINRSQTHESVGVNSLIFGNDSFTFANLVGRYTPNDKVLVSNQLAWMRETFNDENPSRTPLGAGDYAEWVGASTVTWIWNSNDALNAGANVRDIHSTGYEHVYYKPSNTPRVVDEYGGTGTLAGAFAQQSWSFWDTRLTVNAGGRWDHDSIDGVTAFSPQASVTLSPWSSTKFQWGWGQYAQFPEISQLNSNLGTPSLLPERS